ncbi:MAG TPA: hypothetical protein ENJ09_06950 [Planctomycetes bacterium]|nr:hypothetical protein [Planctomycetota bacterium]
MRADRARLIPRVTTAALLGAVVLLGPSCGADDSAPPAEPALGGTELAIELPDPPVFPYERVIFVTIDTLRADHLASYGYPRPTSPFLDQLAEDSLVFTRCMSASSHTAPSHASMFTGLVPGMHGLLTNGERLGEKIPTLAGALRAAGFETAAFTSVSFLEGVATGFGKVRAQTSAARTISSAALTWVKTKRQGDRFLVWMHFYDPHRWKKPEKAPPPYLGAMSERDDDAAFYSKIARLHGLPDPPPGEPFPELAWSSGDRGGERIHPRSRAEVLGFIDSYDAEIAYADAEIRRFAEGLEALDLPGSTLWIVTADHGEGLGSHGYAGHGWQIYNEQLHVPLLFHATDGSIPPGRVDGLVSTVDILPTFVDLLGGRLRGDLYRFGGISLASLLGSEAAREDESFPPPDRQVFSQRRPMRKSGADGVFALQTPDAKYILRMSGDDEFYRLSTDPREAVNAVADGAGEAAALHAAIEEWLRAFGALGRTAAGGDETWLEELRKLGYAR